MIDCESDSVNDSGSDNDGGSETTTADWSLLGEIMSPDTLAALKRHLNNDHDGTSDDANTIFSRCNGNSNNYSNAASAVETATAVSSIPASNKVFKKMEYWDERFNTEESYDWLTKLSDIEDYLSNIISKTDRILMIGCGNSTLSQDMYDAGFVNIVNIDYSKVVIANMHNKHNSTRPKMEWVTMDMLDIAFDSHVFDVVLDKASMDALHVDEDDVWNPQADLIQSTDTYLQGVSRVLKPTGKLIQITFSQPHFRTKYLSGYYLDPVLQEKHPSPYEKIIGYCHRYMWNLSLKTISKDVGTFDYFLFICQK